MFAAGSIDTIRGENGQTYINLTQLTVHLMNSALGMEQIIETEAEDSDEIYEGKIIVGTLKTIVKTLAELGLYHIEAAKIDNVETVDDFMDAQA